MLDLLKVVDVSTDHIIFFDNDFSGYELLNTLRELSIRRTGTVSDNRTKKCPLVTPKDITRIAVIMITSAIKKILSYL